MNQTILERREPTERQQNETSSFGDEFETSLIVSRQEALESCEQEYLCTGLSRNIVEVFLTVGYCPLTCTSSIGSRRWYSNEKISFETSITSLRCHYLELCLDLVMRVTSPCRIISDIARCIAHASRSQNEQMKQSSRLAKDLSCLATINWACAFAELCIVMNMVRTIDLMPREGVLGLEMTWNNFSRWCHHYVMYVAWSRDCIKASRR